MRKLLQRIKDNNMLVEVVNGDLSVFAMESHVDPEVIEEIRENKNELIKYLQNNDQEKFKDSFLARIPKAAEQSSYVLSSSQKRIWILSQFEQGNTAYNISQVYEFNGEANIALLEAAFKGLIDRYEILRTVFRENGSGDTEQYILPSSQVPFIISRHDLRQKENITGELNAALKYECNRSFDLTSAPLIRAILFQTGDARWVFTYVMHHIVSDIWSINILFRELLHFYRAGLAGLNKPLEPPVIQYKDYAVWQQQQLQGEILQEQRSYWLSQLGGELPVLQLPYDLPRPAVKSYRGSTVTKVIDNELIVPFLKLLQEKGATLFMGLLSLVNALLYRCSGQEDIIVGSPVAGRVHPDLEDQPGVFLNTLALRTRFSGNHSFYELLDRVRKTSLDANENQLYPFDELIHELNLRRDSSRSALFDVLIDLHRTRETVQSIEVEDLVITDYTQEHVASKFDLSFMFNDSGNDVTLLIEYNIDLFTRKTIERMHEHFSVLLQSVIENPSATIDQLNILSRPERCKLIHSFNASGSHYPAYRSMISLLEDRVKLNPDDIAVVFSKISLTYKELNDSAERLAGYLIDKYHVKSNDLVGVMLDRSEKMIVSVLAILKAGAAYVPIDPGYPDVRKQYIMEDTGITLILTETAFVFDLHYYRGNLFAVDVELDALENSKTSRNYPIEPGHLAYVIYTSGSTGEPKGCCITHENLSNYIQWANGYYFGAHIKPRFGLYTPLSFDLTVTSLFCPLTMGGSLFVYGQHEPLSTILQHSFSPQSRINAIKLTPSHISILKHLELQSSEMLCAIVGGEKVSADHVNILEKINPSMRIFNEYGPTETTVGCIVHPLMGDLPVLIGKPIGGTRVYILDKNRCLCPIGVLGEICIGGRGLSVGYKNKGELTDQKFITDPFDESNKIYLTGDVGKWLGDGTIAYEGRRDDQVKIRGFRIEPGEVEAAVKKLRSVNEAIAVARQEQGREAELIVYFTGSETIQPSDMRNNLGRLLPGYMVPAYIVQVDEFPLTANGKIDKRKLPDPGKEGSGSGLEYCAPGNEIEEKMALVWQELLGKGKVGANDDFFALGGDSIKAISLIVLLKKRLGSAISIDKLYEHSTIRKLSNYIINRDDRSENGDLTGYLARGFAEIDRIRHAIERENKEKCKLPEAYEDIYPVVPIELGMIYSSMMDPEEPVYYDQFSYRVNIDDLALFTRGLEVMVNRHPMLRTKYYMSSFSQPIKVVLPKIDVPLSYSDISGLDQEERMKVIDAYILRDLNGRLLFDDELLWRVNIFKIEDRQYHITYSFHHALLDGWSVSVLKTELSNFDGGEVPALKHSYRDYCAILLGKVRSAGIDEYWKKLMNGYSRNKLPFNYKGQKIHPDKGMKRVSRGIGNELFKKINQLTSDHSLSFKAVCLAAHIYLLSVTSAEIDVVTGVVTHDRPEIEDGEKILGCFLNTIPVRVDLSKVTTILSLLRQVNSFLVEVKPNEIHLSEIARIIEDKTSSINPVFDTILNFTDFHTYEGLNEQGSYSDPGSENMEVANEMTNTLLDVEVDKTLNDFSVRIKYVPSYFNEADISHAAELYVRILDCFVKDVNVPILSLNLLTEQEQKDILQGFNNTESVYQKDKTINNLFEMQVLKTPEATALTQEGLELSYAALNERANQLAGYLLDHGVKPGDNVGLLVSRTFDMIIGMLGILKAGAAYVPIDPEYPIDRQAYIASNSSIVRIITDGVYPLQERSSEREFVHLQKVDLEVYSRRNPDLPISSKQLAYTIYTSGSTGIPKGVMIEHHSVVNLIEWVNGEFNVGRNDRLLFITSMCFDLSVYDIFGVLSAGGTVVMVREKELHDISRIKYILKSEGITFWDSVPTTMNYLIGELFEDRDGFVQTDVRLVFLSGDWIPVQLPDRILTFFPNARVISLGGATEGTVWSNYFPIGKVQPTWSSIPYGRPIKNNTFYILNDRLKPVPKGVAGELFIGGVGVARGYANNELKTAASFLKDPFNSRLGGMMYRTGDMGRLMAGGDMEFLGRKDNQVKIRGFRVEPGEIESILLKNERIKDAIVDTFKGVDNNNRLCAYLVLQDGIDWHEIKEYLKAKLPDYMVPESHVILDKMPLNSNGKIDRKSLRRPNEHENANALFVPIPPATGMEIKLAQIWKSILHIQSIGVNENVFEAGANSLSVGAFINRVHRELNAAINIREVFSYPTIGEVAGLLENRSKNQFKAIHPVEDRAVYPLSSSQRQLWVLHQFEENRLSYHIPGIYRFEGRLDRTALEYSFRRLIGRHEILRTVFCENELNEVGQSILPATDARFDLVYRDLRTEAMQEEELKRLVEEAFVRPFDLCNGPLIRCNLFQTGDSEWVLSYTMHHIISDGWSTGIVINELLSIYHSYILGVPESLPPLRIQYKDYSVWQQEQLLSADASASKIYWTNQFAGDIPVLELPGDRPRPAVKTFNGKTVRQLISRDLTTKMKLFVQHSGGTLFMGLLSAVNLLLYRYTDQKDIVIGTPSAGRDHSDLENQIGFYVNTLALRTKFNGEGNFGELMGAVKNVTVNAYEHKAYPFDELVNDLRIRREVSRGSLFDVMVILQNNQTAYTNVQEELPHLKISEYEAGENKNSKFDLVFDFVEVEGQILVSVEYNTDIYNEERITLLASHLSQLMETALANPETPLSRLDYLTAAEKSELLDAFNETALPYPDKETIVDLFEQQVNKTPDEIALSYDGTRLSYSALNECANQLSDHLLRSFSITKGDKVGVKLERDHWAVISAIAILKAGGVCVPIDPEITAERTRYIVDNSACSILLSREDIGKFIQERHSYRASNPCLPAEPDALCYVMYTSGSTGHPKGCMLENRGVINHLFSKLNLLKTASFKSLCHTSELHFVGGIWQMWAPLVTGGELVLCSKDELMNIEQLLQKVKKHQASVLELIPAQLNEYLLHHETIGLSPIHTLILTGEKLNTQMVKKCYVGNNGLEIINTYGQTELSDVTCSYKIPREFNGHSILAGKPIQNTSIYVLSNELALCPVGVVGEICTGGAGLCRGYMHEPEMTRDRFIPNPYKEGSKVYRTGDLGRWLPDGNLEVLGRKDEQVKIRGYRIELGEIENALRQLDGIEEAIVLFAAKGVHEKQLIAYLLGATVMNTTHLRAFLMNKIPNYMVPSCFIRVETMPLLPNGKIDKKALQAIKGTVIESAHRYQKPGNDIEEKLVEIWKEVLQIEKVGVFDNFFELGGHSLAATTVVNKIKYAFHINITLQQIFQLTDIHHLAREVRVKQWVNESRKAAVASDADKQWFRV